MTPLMISAVMLGLALAVAVLGRRLGRWLGGHTESKEQP